MRLKLAVIVGVSILTSGGCALMGKRGPAAGEVSAARDLSLQGIAAMERGDWVRAETALRKSLETSPTDAECRRYLAEALWNRGATDDALKEIVTAAQSDRTDAALAVRAGEMLLAKGATQRALAQADQAIRVDPNLSAAWALRGRAYWHLNQPERALADLHRALEFAPTNREVLLDVSAIYRQTSQPSRCLTTLHRLLDTYPPGEEPQQALLMEGQTLAELGRNRQAAECLAAASQHGRPNAQVFYELAQAQASLGSLEAATASAQQALSIDASHQASRQLLTELASRPGPGGAQRR